MIRQRINKIEVEVTQELWVVLQDYKDNIHCCCVKASHGGRRLLAWNEVGLDKGEALNEKVFHFEEALELIFDLMPSIWLLLEESVAFASDQTIVDSVLLCLEDRVIDA